MKRTIRPANAKRVISTAGENNVKDSSKKKGPSSAPVNFRQPVDKQFVMSITEDVDKVIEEGGSYLNTNNYDMLKQIKSDLKVLLNMLQQNETQCISDNIILDSPQNIVERQAAVPQNIVTKDTNKFQKTTIIKNKSIPQNRIMNNPIIKSHSIKTKPGMYQQNIKPSNVEGRRAARKSRLEIYPCFNVSIDSTSESETGVVSESKKVQKLTSFWNDRTKNYPQINLDVPKTSSDKIICGLEYAFELRKKLHEELLSRSSQCTLQSRPWQRTLPVCVRQSSCSSSNQTLAPTLGKSDLNHKTVLKSESKIFKDMSTNTESTDSLSSHAEMKVTNFIKDDGYIKIIINVIGDFSKQISTLVNVGDQIQRNNDVEDIEINLKQSSNKLLNDQNGKDLVVIDCDLGSKKKELNMSQNYDVNSLCIQKGDETGKVSDVRCQVSSSNLENITTTEALNTFDILHSTLPTEYLAEEKPSYQSFEIVNGAEEVSILRDEEENVCDIETSEYFVGGDSSFDQLYSQSSSSLKVNFSICSGDKVEQSDFNLYSNTSFENELNQLNTLEDKTMDFKVSENTTMKNIMKNTSCETIVQDLKHLRVNTMNIDKTVGSENGALTLREKFKDDLIHIQINEETAKFNNDIRQEYSNEISHFNLFEECPLYDHVDKKIGCVNILGKKLPHKDSHCLETFSNEKDKRYKNDHSVIPIIDKNIFEFKRHKDYIKFCQEILNKTSSISLKKNAFNNPLMKSYQEHIIKDLCGSNNFEYIWQKYQKGGFQFISEHDILYLALCHPVVRKCNFLLEETCPFSEMKRKCMHYKINTFTNCFFKNILELFNVGQVISNNLVEVVISQYYCSFRRLTKKQVASFIYHCAISLSMFYIVEEELLGLFSNSKCVYPF